MEENPDLILTNAKIITMTPTPQEADWLAVNGDYIIALGRSGDKSLTGLYPKCMIDCGGKTVLPGIVDAHLHIRAFVKSVSSLQLTPDNGIQGIEDIKQRIALHAGTQSPGTWIKAEGYHEFDLKEKRHPHYQDLDQAAPLHPVLLTHRSGHAHVLNKMAMDFVGIRDDSGDPDGGLIDRDLTTGSPSGLLFEMGQYLSTRVPSIPESEYQAGIALGNQKLLSNGITGFHDVSSSNDEARIRMIVDWSKSELLTPRVNVAMGIDAFLSGTHKELINVVANERVRVSGVKIILDETTGRLFPEQTLLNRWVSAIHKEGLQAIIHAVEEPAIDSACSAIEYALRQHPRLNYRHRIEHCSLCPPNLMNRIAALGVRVVSQPGFLFFNGDRYLATIPAIRMRHLYPFGSLRRKGIRVAGSSDSPVAPLDPMIALQSAVTRKTRSGKCLGDREGMDIREAIKMMTFFAAEAMNNEFISGSLAPGMPADLVILNGDLLGCKPDSIGGLEVEATMINGRFVWQRSEAFAPGLNP